MRILVIEDEPKMLRLIEKVLKQEGYMVQTATDGEEGGYLAYINDYDLIISDVNLPKQNGIDLCQVLRRQQIDTPILLLTAQSSIQDKALGLDSGADDYLTKPFDFEELLARIRALVRRANRKQPVLEVADLTLNPATHVVTRQQQIIDLTSQEYRLLEYLMQHSGEIVNRETLAERVWGETVTPESGVIEVYINYLRNKVDRPFGPKLIHTIRGMGYVLRVP